jgi:pimeloyl-ACP methyl ester carboxylesterase
MQKSFAYNNATIFYSVEGKGDPVLLIHGFGEDSTVWKEQVAFLQNHFMLIVPDLPGTGQSHLLYPDEVVTIEDYADCMHALLLEENISSCAVLGHSMGGYITLAFAEKYASMLNRFGLVHSTAFADSEEKKKSREKSIAMIGEYGSRAFLKNTTPNLFADRFKATHPERINALIEAGASFPKQTLQQYTRAMMLRPDRTHVLLSNYLPVLFVIGTDDVAAPLADVIKQVPLPNISYIHVLPQTGHMGMWEAPELLNRHLLSFLNH